MPNRIIKDSIHDSETVNRMTDFQFRLWVNLITYVDDFGRGDARPAIIKGKCFPLRERLTVSAIGVALEALANMGCISLYEVDGKPYLYFPTWESHQSIRNKKSKYPTPETTCTQLESIEINCNQLTANVTENPNTNPNTNPKNNSELFDRVLSAWNSLKLSQITKISSTRGKMLKARIDENGEEAVFKAIDSIRQSQFLRGDNDRGWVITFDWFLKQSNFQKVAEGNYVDRPKKGYDPNFYGDHSKPILTADGKTLYQQLLEEEQEVEA